MLNNNQFKPLSVEIRVHPWLTTVFSIAGTL